MAERVHQHPMGGPTAWADDEPESTGSGGGGGVSVVHGVYAHNYPLAGLRVRDARVQLQDRMNLDPDCTAEKAAKSATAKATVGIGGRCSPGEAVKDSAKNAVGIDDKGPIEKGRHDDKEAVGATKSAIKNVTQ